MTEPQIRDVTIESSRRFLFWRVSRSHTILRRALLDFEMTAEGANVTARQPEAVVEIPHPWWERMAYWLARRIP